MYSVQQIDALELVLHCIQEHEHKLDELISRLEHTHKLTLPQYLKAKHR